jgi:hypothetical protein
MTSRVYKCRGCRQPCGPSLRCRRCLNRLIKRLEGLAFTKAVSEPRCRLCHARLRKGATSIEDDRRVVMGSRSRELRGLGFCGVGCYRRFKEGERPFDP